MNIRVFFVTMVFVFVATAQVFVPRVFAAELLERSIAIGSSFAGEITTHVFSFRSQGPSTVESVRFEYCANSPLVIDPCIAPVGLDVSGVTIDAQSGVTGYGVSGATTASTIVMNRVSSVEPATVSTYTLGTIQNPSIANESVFVRIGIFDGPDATGTRVDEGSVVFVVDERFDIQAFVPPYMTFCVGITVDVDCTNATGSLATFGELSTTLPAALTSQFSVSTNDPDGYNAFINGQTMTSGNNTIAALPVQSASSPGSSQFGINLRANSSPTVGSDPDAGAVASGAPDALYNTANQFRFVDGDRIAGSTISTGFNRYTVSYIVNVPDNQAPGVYASTLTYTAIATF